MYCNVHFLVMRSSIWSVPGPSMAFSGRMRHSDWWWEAVGARGSCQAALEEAEVRTWAGPWDRKPYRRLKWGCQLAGSSWFPLRYVRSLCLQDRNSEWTLSRWLDVQLRSQRRPRPACRGPDMLRCRDISCGHLSPRAVLVARQLLWGSQRFPSKAV